MTTISIGKHSASVQDKANQDSCWLEILGEHGKPSTGSNFPQPVRIESMTGKWRERELKNEE
jgi:hypothetical protein